MELLTMCASSTYFMWGDRIFEQIHGLPMGSPLSPLLTEIFMIEFEQNALQGAPITPLCWFRKVDDIFSIIDADKDPYSLLQHLNSFHQRLQFTIETEQDNRLPFLDVLVTRQTDKLKTEVYRKPTHTNQYLHWKSNHSSSTKTGIISTLTRRAKVVCSNEQSLSEEINHLKDVFTNQNAYPTDTVNKVINRTLKNLDQPPPRQIPSPSPIMITLPFAGSVSYQIKKLLIQLAKVDVVFINNSPLKDYLHASRKKQATNPQASKGIVYKRGESGHPLNVSLQKASKISFIP